MITETQQTFVLDHRVKCSRAQRFGEELSARIVGQEKAVDATLLAAAANSGCRSNESDKRTFGELKEAWIR